MWDMWFFFFFCSAVFFPPLEAHVTVNLQNTRRIDDSKLIYLFSFIYLFTSFQSSGDLTCRRVKRHDESSVTSAETPYRCFLLSHLFLQTCTLSRWLCLPELPRPTGIHLIPTMCQAPVAHSALIVKMELSENMVAWQTINVSVKLWLSG